MRARRLTTATLAVTLLAPASVLTGSPATAAEATRIVGPSGGPWLEASTYRSQPGVPVHGDALYLRVQVETTAGESVYQGVVTVERRLAGEAEWTTVATSAVDSAYLYKEVKAVRNATYRVLYSGSEGYAPAEDSTGLKVQRDLGSEPVDTGSKLFIKGKVAPRYADRKVTIQRREGSRWARFSVVRTTRKSTYTARVAAPRKVGAKIKYRVLVPAGGGFAASTSPTYVATRSY